MASSDDIEPWGVYGEAQQLLDKIKPILTEEDNLLAWQFALSHLLAYVFLRLADNEKVHPGSVAEHGVATIVDYVQMLHAKQPAEPKP